MPVPDRPGQIESKPSFGAVCYDMHHACCSIFRPFHCLFLPVLVGFVAFLGGCNKDISNRDIQEIALTQIVKLQDAKKPGNLLMIDARSPREFGQRRIPGARNIPLETTFDRTVDRDPSLEKYSYLVVYADDPGSAIGPAVTKRLMTNGYGDVYWFKGGLIEWTRAGLPLEGFAVDTERPTGSITIPR